ncbi:galactosylgalactosylxylosylprotein 3-beta-glucuronosyltransferase P-like isoform X2 [Eriocheir sinensis]|uniref:galactosylgalactosylxylosylprotein 3-beta-glucuronosyltransferase P-like isoform X2 n=1 Tax=Eriocheir sinensis TaxID=95602 RepID=UPI0021C9AF5E|nr:galactosylgalactosylxylosylprotein 3-beta-glucuronosyltransferase P-like isoform X2 [Eriocheir sinensis]
MWRLRVTREVLAVVAVAEALVLAVTVRQLATLEARCEDTLRHPLEDRPKQGETAEGEESLVWPPLYVVTPTYRRAAQLADLTRLAQTLRLVPRLTWVVVEDAKERSEVVAELLERTGLDYAHLAAPTPDEYKERTMLGRGVFNRREGLRWVRQHAHDGVLYFADDDNAYDVRIFLQIRRTQRASVFPVGLILRLGVSSPVVRGGKVVGFHDAFQVLVWHTKTQPAATPSLEHVSHADADTNLIQLYHNLLR